MSTGTTAGDPSVPSLPEGVTLVRETARPGAVPIYAHPGWATDMDWLVQGTTGHGGDGQFDLGLFRETPVGTALERWSALRRASGMATAVHSHQVHGVEILDHSAGPPGLHVSEGYDGHRTADPAILLTVSVADCVPIFLVDPARRAIMLLHGGWRGTAGGILPRGLEAMASPADVWIHLGPAVCGQCYEVGPDVHEALGLAVPHAATPVDVRAVQARQAAAYGVDPERITVSEHCTRCGDGFFSHRGGSTGRQVGFLGIRP